MGHFFAYSVQSAICLAIFYLFYKVLLSRETFHRFNRIALLSTFIFAWIIPLILLVYFSYQNNFVSDAVKPEIETISITNPFTDTVHTAGENIPKQSKNALFPAFLLIYLTGCIACLIYTITSTTRVIQIIYKGKLRTSENKVKLIIHEKQNIPSFSWMNYIVISKSDYEEAGNTIITHEKAHIRLHHTYDLILAQIGIITQWFNPAAWLLYQELQNVHEYEADENVINQGIDAKQYQLLLIKKAVGTRLYSMANSFNHSNLKKRITMMLQKKSNSWARLKYVYVLPLTAITVAVFARPEISQQFDEISSVKINHFASKTGINEVKNFPDSDILASLPNSLEKDFSKTIVPDNANPSDSIYYTVDKMPLFPGGDKALIKYIADNIQYPAEAKNKKIEGRVGCIFTVEKDGSITNIKIKRSIDPALDQEAIRVIKTFPKFTPGENKGKVARVYYSVPVRFSLSGSSNSTEGDDIMLQITTDRSDPTIFIVAEYMPVFPGGEIALLKYIADNIKYPESAVKKGIHGRISCTLVVEKDGSVTNIQIKTPLDPALDQEAIRVLKTLPKFTTPGTVNGEPVRVKYNVPVRFRLPDKTANNTN